MPLNKKTKAIFTLMELFLTQKEISPYDENLLHQFGCNRKTLERYLGEIEEQYGHIVSIKKARKKVWRLVSVSDIFMEFIKNSDDITGLFLMAQEFDPYIFKEIEKGTLSKISKNDEDVFLFKNSIMEELDSDHTKQIFKNLKQAIKRHEYRDIVYHYDEVVVYKNVKCLKLVFMNNNWYLAWIAEDKMLKFSRLSFISKVNYASKNSFAGTDIEPYMGFLKRLQNAMTLYGVEPKTAKLKARPKVAKYFEADMKKYFPSQKFVEKLDDGSIVFTVEYTQELEILPFVQRWLPDIVVVEPQELQDGFKKKLQEALGLM